MRELLGHKLRIVAACAGAGSLLFRKLLETPGASEYFVSGYLPYDPRATDKFLGFTPKGYVNKDVAIELASVCYREACQNSKKGQVPLGIGMTASIASRHEHKGDCRAHIALISPSGVHHSIVTLEKGVGEDARQEHEIDCSYAALAKLEDHEYYTIGGSDDALLTLLQHPVFIDGKRLKELPDDVVLFPGAFNPIHDGHRAMAAAVEDLTGKRVIYSITVDHPHKKSLSAPDVLSRITDEPMYISSGDPLYLDKAKRHPGKSFIIGADAAWRMLDPCWGVQPDDLMEQFYDLGTEFYVFEREGSKSAYDLPYPLFRVMPGKWDISSTAIRGQ